MNLTLRVPAVRAALAALAVLAATLLAGCSYSTESLTQKTGSLDSVVIAPPSVV